MRRLRTASTLVGVSLILTIGCGNNEDSDDSNYSYPVANYDSTCGNDRKERGEVCDGADFGDHSCESVGLSPGALLCDADCQGFATSSCGGACTPNCAGRQCGVDPLCGVSCGSCSGGGICNASGQCESSSPDAPIILTFNVNTIEMDRFDSLIFSAVVTDPDGIQDLIGGTLSDPGSIGTYGAFATAAAEGAYTLTLTWDAIHAVRPIYTGEGGGMRTFRAEFFDVSGNRVQKELQVRLQCSIDPSFAVCGGDCADLSSDWQHCGACDAEVPDGECENGQMACSPDTTRCGDSCVVIDWDEENCGECGFSCAAEAASRGATLLGCDLGWCEMVFSSTDPVSCDDICADTGGSCIHGGPFACEADANFGYGCFHYTGDGGCSADDRSWSCYDVPQDSTTSTSCANWVYDYTECVCEL